MKRAVLGLVLLTLASGCHGRFKRAAPALGDVRAQVLSEQRPSVRLGSAPGEVGMVVDLVNGVKTVDVERKLQRSVDVDTMNAAFLEGLHDGLEGGPPFGLTDEKRAPVLQVEVMNYGLEVPSLGAQGVFTYDLRVRLYDRDGRRVYKTRLSCDTPAGDPKAVSQALGTVNNAKTVDQMGRRAIQHAFDEAAWLCGSELTAKLRKHASPGIGADLRAAVADVDRGWE